jgi:hypothetical protein
LIDKWLREVVVVGAGELVDAERTGPVVEAVVEEGVPEAGCEIGQSELPCRVIHRSHLPYGQG